MPKNRQGTRQLSEETQLEGWVCSKHYTTDTDPHSHLSLHSWVTKGSCHTESTVLLLRAWDAPGIYFSIWWYFWPWGKKGLPHELCWCYCPHVADSPHCSWGRGWGGGSGLMLQSAFSHHLPELGSCHPQMKKGLIIPLPTSREFCIHSALWAFALPWPRRKMTAPPISSWILPPAPYPQATVNQSAMKQLTLLPPPWLGFGAKWHTSETHTSPSI